MTDLSADSQKEKKVSPPKWGNVSISPIILAIIALAFIPILISLFTTSSNLSQRGRATACKPDECSTSSGCQVRGYQQDGYECIGSNQWQSPAGEIIPGGPVGPASTIEIPTVAVSPQVPPVTQASNLEIAKRVLDWTNTLRDTNEIYYNSLRCENNTCSNGFKTNTAGMVAVWSRFKHFLVTKDKADLQVLVKDLNNYLDPQKVESVQGAHWGCKLLFEVWQSNLPELAPHKTKIQDLCLRILNNPTDKGEIDRHILSGQITEPNISELVIGRKLSTSLTTNKDDYTEFAALASEYVTRYQWFSDQKDLQRAKLYLTRAGAMYNPQNVRKTTGDLTTLGISALDLYKITQNNKYLEFAVQLAQSKMQSTCSSLVDCAVTAIFADNISKISNDPKYNNLKAISISELFRKGYDSTKYAFHGFGAGNKIIYPLWDNLLIAGVLSGN